MSITIATNSLFSLELGNRRLEKIVSAKSLNEATEMGIWDTFKDWWYEGEKTDCLVDLYYLSHSPSEYGDSRGATVESCIKTISYISPDAVEFFTAYDDRRRSLVDRLVDSNDADTLKNYAYLLSKFSEDVNNSGHPEFILDSVLKPSLALILQDAPEGPGIAETVIKIHAFLLKACPALLQRYINELLTGPGFLMAIEEGRGVVVERVCKLLTAFPNQAFSEPVKNFLLDRVWFPAGLGNALMSGRSAVVQAYSYLLLILSEQDRLAVIRWLLHATDGTDSLLLRVVERGHSDALIPMLTKISQPFRSNIIELLLQHHDYAGFSLAMWGGDLKDFESCINLLQLMVEPDRTQFWRKMVVDNQRGVRSALRAGDPEDLTRYRPLILAMIKIFQTYGQSKDVYMILENIPKTLLDASINDMLGVAGGSATSLFNNLRSDVTSGNTGHLNPGDFNATLLLSLVQTIVKREQTTSIPSAENFMLKNNGFFVQLIYRCTNHSDSATRQIAEDLYDSYLNLPELSEHKKILAETFMVDNGLRGLDVDGYGKKIDDSVYLFVHQSSGATALDGFVLAGKDIDGILLNRLAYTWPTTGFLTEKDGQLSVTSAREFDAAIALARFPLFVASVKLKLKNNPLAGLLDLLDLNYARDPDPSVSITHNYRHDFNHGLSFNGSSSKLIDDEHQTALGIIFGRYLHYPAAVPPDLRSTPTLTQAHTKQIYQLFKLTEGTPARKLESARKLFCLAAIFTRLSSLDYFGVDGASPVAIRDYAAALLQHAHFLDSSVCGEKYQAMRNRLLGIDGAFSCTSVLYTSLMVPHANSLPDFAAIFAKFKPQGWSTDGH